MAQPSTPDLPSEDAAFAPFPAGTPLHPEILSGVTPETSFSVWQVLRSVALWTAESGEARAGLFDPPHMDAWEQRLLTSGLDPEARFPLAVIVGELAAGAPPGGRLSWACVCVADWALGRGAPRVALAFAEAAAHADPDHPRYAWLVGRLMRSHGDPRRAERWLRRALRLAVDQRDTETQSRALTSLGNLCVETGRYPDARDWHTRALRVSRRANLREQEGMAHHDLFVIDTEEGNRDEAERHAREAIAAYAETSEVRLLKLAHDVAYWWMDNGQYDRALHVLHEMRGHFPKPDDQLRVIGNLARAAGGCGDRAGFERACADAEALRPKLVTHHTEATALIEIAYGAVALGEWTQAASLAREASDAARARSEATVLTRADELLDTLARGAGRPSMVSERRPAAPADRLTAAIVASLRSEPTVAAVA